MEAFFVIFAGLVIMGIAIYMKQSGGPDSAAMVLYEKPRSAEDKIDAYQEKLDPDRGVIKNWWQRRKAVSALKLQTAINDVSSAIARGIRTQTEAMSARTDQEHFRLRADMEIDREKASHAVLIAASSAKIKEYQNQERVIELASAQGMDLNTYLMKIQKLELDGLDIKRLEQEVMTKLKGGFVYQLREYQELAMLRDQLDQLYERSYLIETSEDHELVKLRKKSQVEKDIRLLQEDARGRRKRLLQAYHRANTGGGNENIELR